MNSPSLFIGLRYILTNRRSRSVSFISRVAMLGIILGVALLLVVLSVMNGFDRELRERILSIMPQVTLYHAEGIQEWQPLRNQILEKDSVTAAAPFVELQGMANSGKHTQPILIYGIDPELEKTVSIINTFLNPNTLSQLPIVDNAIVLGGSLAKKLNVVKGDSISIIIPRTQGRQEPPAIRRLMILDVFNTGTELDASLALMGIDAAAKASLNSQVISGLHIKVDDLFSAASTARNIQVELPYGFYTTDWTRTHGNIYYAIKMSKNLVALLLLLIVAIAAFNVVSTLVMVVIDKQSDIAILRTLGTSNQQIMLIFMVQGTIIGVIGTFIGVLLGLLLAFSVQNIVVGIEKLFDVHFLTSDIYPVSYLPSQVIASDVVWVVMISLLMSLLATLYPAWRAAAVKPADALRHD